MRRPRTIQLTHPVLAPLAVAALSTLTVLSAHATVPSPPPKDDLPTLSLPTETALPMPGEETLSRLERLRLQFLTQVGTRYERGRRSAAASGLIPDGEALILRLRIRRLELTEQLLAIKRGRGAYVVLEDFVEAVGFAIEVDERKARGWFLSEEARFFLDLDARTVRVRGKSSSWPVGQVLATEDGLLVHSDLLARWFGFEITVDMTRQVMRLAAPIILPVEKSLYRKRRFERLSARQSQQGGLGELTSEHRAVALPHLDLQLTTGHARTQADARAILRGSIQGGGDLAYASANTFLAGDEQSGITAFRLRLDRNDLKERLPGQPLTGISVGDVRTANIPILTGSVEERGISLTNEGRQGTGPLSSTELIGDVTAGWDVELYRNGVLIGLDAENLDGRYEFTDVPLFPGTNEFRLVFYGPQGQIREEERVIPLVGPSGVGAGATATVSLTQQGRTLYQADTTDQDGVGALRAVADVRVPLPGGKLGRLNYLSLSNGSQRQHYLSAGSTLSLGRLLLDANLAVSGKGGFLSEAVTGGNFLGQQLRGAVAVQRDYTQPGQTQEIDETRVNLSVAGRVNAPIGNGVSYTLTNQWQRTNSVPTWRNTLLLGTRMNRVNVTTELDRIAAQTGDADRDEILAGATQTNLVLGKKLLRGQTRYEFLPEPRMVSAGGTLTMRDWENTSATVQLEQDFLLNRFTAEGRLDWDFGTGFLGPRVIWDSDGRREVQVQSRVSLGVGREEVFFSSQALSTRAAVEARVFVDQNGDGRANSGETFLAEVPVEAVQQQMTVPTDQAGAASLVGLPTERRIDIRVAEGAFEDQFMAPSVAGRSVRLRRGETMVIDLPVMRTGEVEGTVLQREREGTRPVQGTVNVNLISPKGQVVASTPLAFDGFFALSDVIPGTYLLSVDPLGAGRPGLVQPVEIQAERTELLGDLVLDFNGETIPWEERSVMKLDLGRFQSEFGALAQWLLLRRMLSGQVPAVRRVRGAPDKDGTPLTVEIAGGYLQAKALCKRLKSITGHCSPRHRASQATPQGA